VHQGARPSPLHPPWLCKGCRAAGAQRQGPAPGAQCRKTSRPCFAAPPFALRPRLRCRACRPAGLEARRAVRSPTKPQGAALRMCLLLVSERSRAGLGGGGGIGQRVGCSAAKPPAPASVAPPALAQGAILGKPADSGWAAWRSCAGAWPRQWVRLRGARLARAAAGRRLKHGPSAPARPTAARGPGRQR
jgi:hypothetical protein